MLKLTAESLNYEDVDVESDTCVGKVAGSVTKRSSVLTTVVVVATPIALANRWIRIQTVGIAVVIS